MPDEFDDFIDDRPSATPVPKAKGWPKGKPRGVRKPVRDEAPVRQARQEPRSGRAEAVGRDGEMLTRRRPADVDEFYVPAGIIPYGWEYQWNVETVTGEPQTSEIIAMQENGWRPVPAGRHRDMFMPKGYPENGLILRKGLRLDERPKVLSDEARNEELAKAGRLVKDQQEQLGLTQKMPSGFSRDNPNLRRMERSGTSRTYAPAGDIPRPQLPIDPNG